MSLDKRQNLCYSMSLCFVQTGFLLDVAMERTTFGKEGPMAHEDIRIKFEVGDHTFEAVGFLRKGEKSVSGDEVFRRVPDVIGEKDANYLYERYSRLAFPPARLQVVPVPALARQPVACEYSRRAPLRAVAILGRPLLAWPAA